MSTSWNDRLMLHGIIRADNLDETVRFSGYKVGNFMGPLGSHWEDYAEQSEKGEGEDKDGSGVGGAEKDDQDEAHARS